MRCGAVRCGGAYVSDRRRSRAVRRVLGMDVSAPPEKPGDAWHVLSDVLYVRGRVRHIKPETALLKDVHMFRAHPETGRIGGLASSLLRSFAFVHQADPDVFLGGPQRDMEDSRRTSLLQGEDVSDLAKNQKSVLRETRVRLKAVSGMYGQTGTTVYELVRRKVYVPSSDGTVQFSNRVLVSMNPVHTPPPHTHSEKRTAADGKKHEHGSGGGGGEQPAASRQSGDREQRVDSLLKRTGSGVYAQGLPGGRFSADGPEESPRMPFQMPTDAGGNLDEEHYYSPKVKAHRRRLRQSPMLTDLMCSLWMLLLKRFAKAGEDLKEPTSQRLPKVGYLALARHVQNYFVPETAKAREASGLMAADLENDWVCDGGRKGGTADLGVMAFSTFFKAVFELVDAWVVGFHEDDFMDVLLGLTEGAVEFLQNGYNEVPDPAKSPQAGKIHSRLPGLKSPGPVLTLSEQAAIRRKQNEEDRYLLASQGRVIHGTFIPTQTPSASVFFGDIKPKAATRAQDEFVSFILSNKTAEGGTGRFAELRESLRGRPLTTTYGRRLPGKGMGYVLPPSARASTPHPVPAGGFRRLQRARTVPAQETTRQRGTIMYSERSSQFEPPPVRSASPGTVLPGRALRGAGAAIEGMDSGLRALKPVSAGALLTPI